MRVDITYSIDFEEVPKEMKELVQKVKDTSCQTVDQKFTELLTGLSEEDERKAIQAIEEIREHLAKIDMRLMECSNILTGYQKALILAPNEPPKDPPAVKFVEYDSEVEDEEG